MCSSEMTQMYKNERVDYNFQEYEYIYFFQK